MTNMYRQIFVIVAVVVVISCFYKQWPKISEESQYTAQTKVELLWFCKEEKARYGGYPSGNLVVRTLSNTDTQGCYHLEESPRERRPRS